MAKQYTQAEWARIQSRLPEEDRVPYAESPEKFDTPADVRARIQRFAQRIEPGVTEEEFPTSVTTPRGTATSGSSIIDSGPKRYYNYYTGEYVDDPSKIKPRTGPESDSGTIQVTEPVVDTTGYKVVNGVLQFNGQPFTGTYNGQTYENGIVKSAADTTGYKVVNGVLLFNGQPFSGTYSGQTYENGKVKLVTDGNNNNATGYQEVDGVLQFNGEPFTGTFAGTVYENGVKKVTTAAVTATNTLTTTQQDIMSTVLDRLNRYNLGSLAPLIKKLAIEGASEATIMLRLQDEPLYQERFKANQQRIKKGISVLTPSEYLNLEDSYRQILRAYGLNQFDNDAYVGQFISNDVSPTELSNRVVTAVQRVRNADPAVSNMLKNYYGIGQNDLVAYVLDPNQQFQKIERQVAASEIGVAAGRQGINIGVPVAEQLAAQGITRAEAQRGYATIADVLPTAEKLSGIYGTTLDKYGLEEGEQEVFNTLASAQRKRQRLIGREAAEFSGQSGISRGALGTATGGQY
jgi:hypothetical protein